MTVFFSLTESGKAKARKHKQIFPVTARAGGGSPDRVGGGVSRPVARGQKFMCCVRNPRSINIFVRVPGREESGSRPGGSVTGVTEKLVMCQMFMCLFRPPQNPLALPAQDSPKDARNGPKWIELDMLPALCPEFPNAVALSAVGLRNTQMSAKERK